MFSEFELAVCGEDTAIRFWHALQYCALSLGHDTLLVEEIKYLPTGKNFIFEPVIWTYEKIYFEYRKAQYEFKINRHIRKYNKHEIQQTLTEYETSTDALADKKMELASKLFICAVSADEKAGQYFKEFETKFGTLDGEFAEHYSDLAAMLELWEK